MGLKTKCRRPARLTLRLHAACEPSEEAVKVLVIAPWMRSLSPTDGPLARDRISRAAAGRVI